MIRRLLAKGLAGTCPLMAPAMRSAGLAPALAPDGGYAKAGLAREIRALTAPARVISILVAFLTR